MLLRRMMRHVVAVAMKLEIMRTSQVCDKFLIRIRLAPPQLVIEMNDGENNSKFAAQLQQQAQKRNGINPAGNGDTNAVSGLQQLLPPDVRKHALRE